MSRCQEVRAPTKGKTRPERFQTLKERIAMEGHTMGRRAAVLLVLVLSLLLPTMPVRAITYGEPDGTRHPNVGPWSARSTGRRSPTARGP